LPFIGLLTLAGCKKDDDDSPQPSDEAELVFKFRFDSTQQRLNNRGQPTSVPDTHAAQHPRFNGISAHYIEIIPDKWTKLGEGQVLYGSPETTAGGDTAIDFDQSVVVDEGQVFQKVKLSGIEPGEYKYLRVSLSYQNYDIDLRAQGMDLTGTLASFIGFNTYIESFKIKDSTITVNDNKKQGYWGFETQYGTVTGQAPGTTLPNPISKTSPIPPGSCLVTGEFQEPLSITGDEDEDQTVIISVSTNKSFEWKDPNDNGLYDPPKERPGCGYGYTWLEGSCAIVCPIRGFPRFQGRLTIHRGRHRHFAARPG